MSVDSIQISARRRLFSIFCWYAVMSEISCFLLIWNVFFSSRDTCSASTVVMTSRASPWSRYCHDLNTTLLWIYGLLWCLLNQCCGSGMFIPDPDFYPSRISDKGSQIQKQQQKRGVKKFVVISFFVATHFTQLKIILIWKCWRKKCGQIFKELQNFLLKSSLSSQIWVWDPGFR